MKRFSIVCSMLAAFAVAPVMAQQQVVPFSTPPVVRNASEAAVATLANIMANAQLRHIKLWAAGKAKNWDLVGYEAQKLEDDFITAAAFYRNLPVDNVVQADQPLKRLMEAARNKDSALFTKAFDELTVGCNSCHAAGQVGYIRIQTPKSSPFTDQKFER